MESALVACWGGDDDSFLPQLASSSWSRMSEKTKEKYQIFFSAFISTPPPPYTLVLLWALMEKQPVWDKTLWTRCASNFMFAICYYYIGIILCCLPLNSMLLSAIKQASHHSLVYRQWKVWYRDWNNWHFSLNSKWLNLYVLVLPLLILHLKEVLVNCLCPLKKKCVSLLSTKWIYHRLHSLPACPLVAGHSVSV